MRAFLLTTLIAFLSVASLSTQTVRDRNNMKIGSVGYDGTVRDRNNMKIGSIGKDGTVRDRNNMKIGTANGVNMYHIAVYYFFNLL